ncbi:MAG TPA: CbiX/SirB N-terminal domain-containing protein [Burkholderiaceae bacterium]|nr:CbiX/SirB N-terminal domain-containing protein [Burkholderiaceae bacterium]
MEAMIVFAHGARDPRWAEPFERITARISAQRPQSQVRLAFLELMQPSLPDAVQDLAAQGCTRVVIVPAFLGQGGHVRRDLPALVEALSHQHPHIRFDLATAVGESDEVINAIARVCLESFDNGTDSLLHWTDADIDPDSP